MAEILTDFASGKLNNINYNKIFDISSRTNESFFQVINPMQPSVSYQNMKAIESLGLTEEDYVKIEEDLFAVDWKNLSSNNFACNNSLKLLEQEVSSLISGLKDEVSNIFVCEVNGVRKHFSRKVKRHDNVLVAMVIETNTLIASYFQDKEFQEINNEVLRNTSSFYAQVVYEDQIYIVFNESIENFGIFDFSSYKVECGSYKIPISDYILSYVDYGNQETVEFYNDKLMSVINKEITSYKCITKMKVNVLEEQVELFLKTSISVLDSGRIVLIYTDYTSQQLAIEKEELRKVTDHFTGLRNRAAFGYDYDETKFKNCVVSFVDLKNLEFINEMYDRRTGDIYLSKLGSRLKGLGENTICYRLGGDEFVVVTNDFSTEEVPTILSKISKPITIGENTHKVTASMFYVDLQVNNFSDLKDILSILDYTRKTYKDHVAGSCIEVNEQIFINYGRQKVLYKELSQGFDESVVYPLFQPYIDTKTKRVMGFESLARIVINDVIYQPFEFIPVLESMNLIYKLDIMMFEESCKMKLKFDRMSKGNHDFIASSNLSPKSFKMLKVSDFQDVINRYGVDKDYVKIELTEQDKINTFVSGLLEDLIENGFNISIDDFSAGHSSLKYIAEIKSNTLKVDRQLLQELDHEGSEKTMIIYKNIVNLAKALDMEVVSEGVETEEQVSILQKIGVNYLQGFFFSRPIPKIEFMEYAIQVND